MNKTCPVCEGNIVVVREKYRSKHPIFMNMSRVHCDTCGMDYADPMPAEKDIEHYNSEYFASAHGGKPEDPQTKAFFSGIANIRHEHVEKYLRGHNISVASVLEMGPGLGYFPESWLQKHPTAKYYAIESDLSCHIMLNDLGVHIYSPTEYSNIEDEVSLIVMSHVLEHVTNPNQFLDNVTSKLRKGGAIFIEVPCRDWEHKSMDEPHLLFFDKESMTKLLINHGFKNIQTSYHGTEIKHLRSPSFLRKIRMSIRSRLINMGVIAPFSSCRPGMETLNTKLERAVLAPFNAHKEMDKPAWWLRAVAQKK